MVLSLQEISLVSIRNAIKNGMITRLDLLSPHMRQKVLDMVLMHGTINLPSCINTLSSPKFLNGMTTLNFCEGQRDDSPYLRGVAKSLIISIDENGENTTIGEKIEELRFNLYKTGRTWETRTSNIRDAARLIALCPNLCTLHINVEIGYDVLDYSQESDIFQFLISYQPIINFEKLTSFKFSNGRLNLESWYCFLNRIKKALINLDFWFYNVNCILFSDVFPFHLPKLENLSIGRSPFDSSYITDETFVDNLRQCANLKKITLGINASDKYLHHFTSLLENKPPNFVDLRIKLAISDRLRNYAIDYSDNDSTGIIKAVTIFNKNINECLFHATKPDSRWPLAVMHLLNECPNLENIMLYIHDLGEITKSILSFFVNGARHALKVTDLNLHGNLEYSLLKSIFENCSNLTSLRIYDCETDFNDCLIDFADRSNVIPFELLLFQDCDSITESGLIPLLIKSGGALRHFQALNCKKVVGDQVWNVLFEHCRYMVKVFGCPLHMKHFGLSKNKRLMRRFT